MGFPASCTRFPLLLRIERSLQPAMSAAFAPAPYSFRTASCSVCWRFVPGAADASWRILPSDARAKKKKGGGGGHTIFYTTEVSGEKNTHTGIPFYEFSPAC